MILTLARLTVLELVRRRIVWVLAALTIASVVLVTLGVGRLVGLAREHGVEELQVRVGVSQVLILIAFTFSFVLAMTAAFLGAPAIGADLESGVALAILARPVRRADYLLGRWLGLAVAVVVYSVTSGALAIVAVAWIAGSGPPEPVLALAFLAAQVLVLLTLTLALGVVLPSIGAGAVAVVAFGVAWMVGVLEAVATVFGVEGFAGVAQASRLLLPSDGLWRGVIYGLEPPIVSLIAAGRDPGNLTANPFFAAAPPSLAFDLWSLAWVVVVLALAAWRLERREL